MSDPSDNAAFEMALNRLDLRLPPADIEQLRRAFQRQRTALRSWEEQVLVTTEPAHAFSLYDSSSVEPSGETSVVTTLINTSTEEAADKDRFSGP